MKPQRVSIIGLGRFGGGIAAARFCAEAGCRVTVSDMAPAEKLADSLAQLADLDLTLHLGGHQESDFLDTDLLVVNPAVKPGTPLLLAAVDRGVSVTTEINLFLERCPAPVVAVTGSVGKSTTAAMTTEVLRTKYTVHFGGNIGRSLLADLPAIRPHHLVVLELSSFQLHYFPKLQNFSGPRVALVTNLTDNHLDWHGSLDAYAADKKNIAMHQHPKDALILNLADPAMVICTVEMNGEHIVIPGDDGKPDWPSRGKVIAFNPAGEGFDLSVPGAHNQANANAAFVVGQQFGVSRKQAAEALKHFTGLEHRLQFVCEKNGVRYFNDSKCTTPNGAIVALEAFEPRTAIMLVGGYDKGADFAPLAGALADTAAAVVTFGQTGPAIADLIAQANPAAALHRAEDLSEALSVAQTLTQPGQAVVLSPACASYDQFDNYEQRGRAFVQMLSEKS